MNNVRDQFVVSTSVGDLRVTIHGLDRASVYAAGPDERVQVGKFEYRVNISLVDNGRGNWEIQAGGGVPNAYHTEGKHYFNPAAPTIKAKIEKAAVEALLTVLKENPAALFRADVENAQANWARRNNDLEEMQDKVAVAQRAANEAERAYYDAVDRLDAVELTLQRVGAQ